MFSQVHPYPFPVVAMYEITKTTHIRTSNYKGKHLCHFAKRPWRKTISHCLKSQSERVPGQHIAFRPYDPVSAFASRLLPPFHRLHLNSRQKDLLIHPHPRTTSTYHHHTYPTYQRRMPTPQKPKFRARRPYRCQRGRVQK